MCLVAGPLFPVKKISARQPYVKTVASRIFSRMFSMLEALSVTIPTTSAPTWVFTNSIHCLITFAMYSPVCGLPERGEFYFTFCKRKVQGTCGVNACNNLVAQANTQDRVAGYRWPTINRQSAQRFLRSGDKFLPFFVINNLQNPTANCPTRGYRDARSHHFHQFQELFVLNHFERRICSINKSANLLLKLVNLKNQVSFSKGREWEQTLIVVAPKVSCFWIFARFGAGAALKIFSSWSLGHSAAWSLILSVRPERWSH